MADGVCAKPRSCRIILFMLTMVCLCRASAVGLGLLFVAAATMCHATDAAMLKQLLGAALPFPCMKRHIAASRCVCELPAGFVFCPTSMSSATDSCADISILAPGPSSNSHGQLFRILIIQ